MSEYLDPQAVLAHLQQQLGVRYFTGVPDSVLAAFCAQLAPLPDTAHVIAVNEGSAVGLAIGDHLASGAVPLVYMQNSGIGNAINPLLSLASPGVYGVPMLLLIGWRGEPGKADEPQHRLQGQVLDDLLDACCVARYVLDAREGRWRQQFRDAHDEALSQRGPVAVVVPMGTFEKYSARVEEEDLPTREQAIACVLDASPSEAVVVATTGMAGRELFELRAQRGEDHGLDFYNVGGMGHASQIALAIARRQPSRPVICLDGDGAALMHLGAMTTVASLGPGNLLHVVLNNGVHDSVGGQPTAGRRIDFPQLASALGYPSAQSARSTQALAAAVRAPAQGGPRFIDAQLARGCRADLGRPTHGPLEQKGKLMRTLGVG